MSEKDRFEGLSEAELQMLEPTLGLASVAEEAEAEAARRRSEDALCKLHLALALELALLDCENDEDVIGTIH